MRVSGLIAVLAGMLLLLVSSPGGSQTINCTCRYQGVSYSLKACVCINRGNGPEMACCGMVLNNTSWKFTKQACPIARAPQTGIFQSAALPYSPVAELQSRGKVSTSILLPSGSRMKAP